MKYKERIHFNLKLMIAMVKLNKKVLNLNQSYYNAFLNIKK